MKKLLAMSLLLSSCWWTTEPVVYDVKVTRNVAFTETLDMDIFSPVGDKDFPTVVLFHGGSWYGGERVNVEGLADVIASKGAVVYNATYTVGGAGGGYPGSYEDIRCALSAASELAGASPLTVVGYSAGAHLAATVVLSGDEFSSEKCTSVAGYDVSWFVGLAGPYETTRYGPLLANWFGTTVQDDPERWALGNPGGYIVDAEHIPILLLHGDGDQVVQLGFSEEFNAALAENGFDVVFDVLEGADHATIVDPLGDGAQVAEIIFQTALLPAD